MVDYTPYLRVTKDRYIWWRLEDAIRLGAGFHPFADDHAVLATELRIEQSGNSKRTNFNRRFQRRPFEY